MDELSIIAQIVKKLQGEDQKLWSEIFVKALESDPYLLNLSRTPVLDRISNEMSVDLLRVVSGTQKVSIDEYFLEMLKQYKHSVRKMDVVQFDPQKFGVERRNQQRKNFGLDWLVSLEEVTRTANSYGLVRLNMQELFCFQATFLGKQSKTEGTRFYVPLGSMSGSLKLPRLDYNRYTGASIQISDVTDEGLVPMYTAAGQGEFHETTFLFGRR